MHGKLRVVLHFGSFSLSLKNHKVPCTIPLAQLPLHLSNARPNPPEFLKQEATLAVQGTPPLSDFLPVNKFSSAPLLMEVVRVVLVRSIALALVGMLAENHRYMRRGTICTGIRWANIYSPYLNARRRSNSDDPPTLRPLDGPLT